MEEPLQIAWSRPVPEKAKPSSVTVSKDTAGLYYVSLHVEEDIKPLDVTTKKVGLDLVIKSKVIN
jgi:putative transposase